MLDRNRLGSIGGLVVHIPTESSRSKDAEELKLPNHRMEASLVGFERGQALTADVHVSCRVLLASRWSEHYW